MKRDSEPFEFAERHFALLDRSAALIRPEDDALDAWFANYCREHRNRLAADLRIIETYVPPGARILEYGAVPLVMTAAFTSLEYEVHALDVMPERFEGAIRELGLDVTRCDVETEPAPFESEIFDVVLFNEIFEHLRINPIFTLREATRVLKREGRLLLSTPNLRSFRGIRNLVFRNEGHAVSAGIYPQYEKLASLGHMGHVREYTTREVSEFLTRLGLRVETIIYRGGYGRGAVGLAEQIAPSFRPFFTAVANKKG